MVEIDEEWSRLSLNVAQDVNNFQNWEKLISYVSRGLNKASKMDKIELMRASYQQFLSKFPLLEQHWVNYADLEFKLGHTDRCRAVYEQAINFNRYSNLIWVNYLKKLQLIELDYERLVAVFQRVEELVGLHYHSYEFWDMFVHLEKSYNGESHFYFNILRKVIELPIYNYSYFFSIWLQHLENLNETTVLKIITKQELQKKFKINVDEVGIDKIDYKDLIPKVKKVFIDLYITTQFKSYELYRYEKKIDMEYFVPNGLRSYQNITNWLQYIEFIELNYKHEQVVQVYERCLIPLAYYPEVWLKYFNYYLTRSEYQNCRNVLNKALLFVSDEMVLTKLIKLELSLNNLFKAKDLIELGLSYNFNNYEYLVMLINVEYLLSQEEPQVANTGEVQSRLGKFKEFVVAVIESQKDDSFAVSLIQQLLSFKDLDIGIEQLEQLNTSGRFDNNHRYWLLVLNYKLQAGGKTGEFAELQKYFKQVYQKCAHAKLLEWFDNYLGYEDTAVSIDEMFEFDRAVSLV